jgi:hypothetical protein
VTAFDVVAKDAVAVLNPDGRVTRQRVPDGVNPIHFRHVLMTVDLFWNDEGRFPTPHEARNLYPSLPLKTYQTVFATEEFSQALQKRGISPDPLLGLTELQMAALTVLSNPVDQRSTTSKLSSVGATQGQYRAWMRNPHFARALRTRAEQNLGDAIPVAINRLVGNAEASDQRAIEFLLKMSGRYDPAAVEVENARVVVLTLVEAIQAEVKDPAIRERILGTAAAKMKSVTILESLKEIE